MLANSDITSGIFVGNEEVTSVDKVREVAVIDRYISGFSKISKNLINELSITDMDISAVAYAGLLFGLLETDKDSRVTDVKTFAFYINERVILNIDLFDDMHKRVRYFMKNPVSSDLKELCSLNDNFGAFLELIENNKDKFAMLRMYGRTIAKG